MTGNTQNLSGAGEATHILRSTRPRRVAVIAGSLGLQGGYMGGAERQLHYIARALAEVGVDVRVYSLEGEPASAGSFGLTGVECRNFGRIQGPPLRLLLLLAGLCRFRPHVIQSVHQAAAVQFLGAREDIGSLLRQAAMFVFCSESEGTPNVILEAMAAGLPVITTLAGDVVDVVRPAGAGYIVPFGNVDAIASAMFHLARFPKVRSELGAAGRSYISRNRDASKLAERLLGLYTEVARSASRGRASLLKHIAQHCPQT